MLVRRLLDQLVVVFAFAGLVVFVESAKGDNGVPYDRFLLPRFEQKRFPEAGFGSTRKGWDCANLEAVEDAAFLGIAWERCRDRWRQEELRPSYGRFMWRRQRSSVWLAGLLSGEFVPVTGPAGGGTAEARRFALVTFNSPYLDGSGELDDGWPQALSSILPQLRMPNHLT